MQKSGSRQSISKNQKSDSSKVKISEEDSIQISQNRNRSDIWVNLKSDYFRMVQDSEILDRNPFDRELDNFFIHDMTKPSLIAPNPKEPHLKPRIDYHKKAAQALESKLWVLIHKGGVNLYLKILHKFINLHLQKPSNRFDLVSNGLDIKNEHSSLIKQLWLKNQLQSGPNQAKRGYFMESQSSLGLRAQHKLEEPCGGAWSELVETKRVKTDGSAGNAPHPMQIKPCYEYLRNKIMVGEEFEFFKTQINTQMLGCDELVEKRVKKQDLLQKVLQAVRGEVPRGEWLQRWGADERLTFWIVMLKLELVPKKWVEDLETLSDFPSEAYVRPVSSRKKMMLFNTYLSLMCVLLVFGLEQKKAGIEEVFEVYLFEKEMRLEPSQEELVKKYIKTIWEKFAKLNNKSVFKFKAIVIKKDVKGALLEMMKHLTCRHIMFEKLKSFFVDRKNNFQKDYLDFTENQIDQLIKKVLDKIKRQKFQLENLRVYKERKKLLQILPNIEIKRVILRVFENMKIKLKM